MRKKWIAALMVVVLLLQILPFSVLADGGVSTAESSVKWVYLRPDSTKTDVHLEFVRVEIVSPSRIKVEAKGVYNVNLPPFAFSLNIDLAQKTYIAHRITLPTKGSSLDASPNTYVARPAIVRLQTKDPAFITLNETTDYLRWKVNDNGTVTYLAWDDSCWAANPSPVGTHWYCEWCTNDPPWYEYYGHHEAVYNTASGHYINWDFGDPNLSTEVYHSITIKGKNDGNFVYWISYTDWGEYAWLLHHSVVVGR